MSKSMESRLRNFLLGSEGSHVAASEVEQHLGIRLPDDYKKFMKRYDGGEGFVGERYLMLWRMEELVEFNRDYEVEDYAPGILLFGSSGGGEAFAFDTHTSEMPIIMLPFVGMSLEDAIPIAGDFDEFLTYLADADT